MKEWIGKETKGKERRRGGREVENVRDVILASGCV